MMGLEQMRYNGQEIHVVRKTLLAYTPLELPKLCPDLWSRREKRADGIKKRYITHRSGFILLF